MTGAHLEGMVWSIMAIMVCGKKKKTIENTLVVHSVCWCFKGRQEDVQGFNRNNIGNLTIIILLFRLYIHKIS